MNLKLRVWAPLPAKVEIQTTKGRFPMTLGKNGWWTAEIPPAETETDYGFVLDGEGPFPDPRSPWQPRGVHGLSRLLEHRKFRWTDAHWQAPPLSSAVIYELHVGTFTPKGTFDGVIEKLGHLVALGITHIQLMPVAEFPGTRGWGYDVANIFAPHHAYVGPEGLKRLVDACHARQLAVLLDVVYNHLGPEGNHLHKYAAYFSRFHRSPWGQGLNFDGPESSEVRRYFCDNAIMWLRDYHLDGLRLDAVHAITDFSALPFLEQLALEVKALEAHLARPLVLIPESDLNDPRLLRGREYGGVGLHAQWSDDFHHALHTVLTGEKNGYYADFGTFDQLAKALRNAFVYDGNYSINRRRHHGRSRDGLEGHRFLGYLQNHDQVGNRPQGERSSQLLNTERLKIGAALVLTSPFIPMLFQGEEWGASTPFPFFAEFADPKLADCVRDGRIREFAELGWAPGEIPDPQARETFERAKLNWSEQAREPHSSLLEWHRRLIRLRREHPSLSDGCLERVQVEYDEAARWLVVRRGAISVACNLTNAPRPVRPGLKDERVLVASAPFQTPPDGNFILPADSVAITESTTDRAPA